MRQATLMLLAEANELPPLLRGLDAAEFDRPTALPGWSVRDVLAHCSGAMRHIADGTMHRFSVEDNAADVAMRTGWPIQQLLEELVSGYRATADAIEAADGLLDGLGLGEWVHGGDVRDALGRDDAYISAGSEYAIDLIVERSVAKKTPGVQATVGVRRFVLGVGEPAGELSTDLANLVRLVAGRRAQSDRYQLSGVAPEELVLFT